MNQTEISQFFCTKCGHSTIPIQRHNGGYREPGHLKNLYCPYCREEHNCVEVRPDNSKYTFDDFQLEFQAGNFTKEGKRKMPYNQFKQQKPKCDGTLILMCGIPASGKSSFARNAEDTDYENIYYVSRDGIRFGLIASDDDYFKREKAVFKEFVKDIEKGLYAGKTVYADATHINPASRSKLLKALHIQPKELGAVYFETPLEVCLERNAKRVGRFRVPDEVIKKMAKNYIAPSCDEGFDWVTLG